MRSETSILLLYAKVADDPRVNVWQMSLYIFILALWQKSGYQQQLKVSRKQLMTGARFRSITTYHKCISHLNNLNYISYQPTYDSYEGSTIQVLP